MEIAGIDAESIVTQLMQIEQQPLTALQGRQASAKVAADAIARLKTSLDAFRLAAARLADTASFDRFATSVSNADAMAARVTGTATAGSLTFTVDRLAQAQGLRSVGTVASSAAPVTVADRIAVAAGTRALGFGTVAAGGGLGLGSLTLRVTQASAAATISGGAALGATTVDGSNDTLQLSVDGAARTVTLAHGSYDAVGLAAAVQAALDASGGGVVATAGASGALTLATRREGSEASLEVTGGSALAALGLATSGSPAAGTDGILDAGGTQVVVTRAEAGRQLAIPAGAGPLDVTLSGGLRVGSSTVAVVSTGDRSLAAVAAAITGANAGVTAAAVNTGTSGWRLQLTARATGQDGEIAIDPAAFSAIGGLVETSAAQNARITVGTGPGAYSIEAAGNTFTDVLGGVTLTARAVSAAPITVSVTRDDNAVADDVAAVVSAANSLLAEIKVQTRYDPATRTSGPLAGNGTIRRLADQVRQALAAPVAGLTAALPSNVGIEIQRDGSFAFDRAELLAALAADPAAISRMFGRGGTATGDAVFAAADARTVAGAYDVVITTAASRATSALLFDGGVAATGRVGVQIGSVTALVDVTAGETAAQVADRLNARFAEAGLAVTALTEGGGLRIHAQQWGTAGNFQLNEDVLGAGSWIEQAGTDVAGTIDGVAATGAGRRLSLPALATSPAAGLAIDVAEGVTGPLGQVEYGPGIAARVVEVATALTDVQRGLLTSAQDAANRRVTDFNAQIERFEDRLAVRETNLRRQWANLQTVLSSLQSQSDWIAGQLAGLPKNWGGS